jgi:hypothetical protein
MLIATCTTPLDHAVPLALYRLVASPRPTANGYMMLKVAWDKAFTRERNMKGWEKKGILPRFNRKGYWRFKAELDAAEADGATVSSKGGSDNNNDGMSCACTPRTRTVALVAPLKFNFFYSEEGLRPLLLSIKRSNLR